LGVSDRWHFAWLCDALSQFEREQGALRLIGGRGPVALAALAEQRLTPPLTRLTELIGRERTRVDFFNKYSTDPAVTRLDFNDLGAMDDDAYDVVTLSRASYFIANPERFLAHLSRILRPGGLAVIDWLHGLSNAPLLAMPGTPHYGGDVVPFLTTYGDAQFLSEFPEEFAAFIGHVNRPPWWVDPTRPGRRRTMVEGLRCWLAGAGKGPTAGEPLTPETYLPVLDRELARAGKRLIDAATLESHFKVLFRHARYFYPYVRKFNLYLLTVLTPVGK
jgi:SAM-dependent methyltransferase